MTSGNPSPDLTEQAAAQADVADFLEHEGQLVKSWYTILVDDLQMPIATYRILKAQLMMFRESAYTQGKAAGLREAAKQARKGATLWEAGMGPREAGALEEFAEYCEQQANQQAGAGGSI